MNEQGFTLFMADLCKLTYLDTTYYLLLTPRSPTGTGTLEHVLRSNNRQKNCVHTLIGTIIFFAVRTNNIFVVFRNYWKRLLPK